MEGVLKSGGLLYYLNTYHGVYGRILFLFWLSGAIRAVAVSADSKYIASASYDKTIRLWRTREAKCLHTLEGIVKPSPKTTYIKDHLLIKTTFDTGPQGHTFYVIERRCAYKDHLCIKTTFCWSLA